jgi:hypothetical protein
MAYYHSIKGLVVTLYDFMKTISTVCIFGISINYLTFHRKPLLDEMMVSLFRNKRVYFFYPLKTIWQRILKKNTKNVDSIKRTAPICASLYTLAPLSFIYRSEFLIWLCIALPIQLQLKYRYKISVSKSLSWHYKPEQFLHIKKTFQYHVYENYDNYRFDKSYFFARSRMYDEYLNLNFQRCCLSLISSIKQCNMYQHHSSTMYFPNAVSTRFLIGHVNASELPFNVLKKETKTVGYVGNIDESIDTDLIEALVNRLKSVNFLLIGPIKNAKMQLLAEKYKNLHLIGPVPYDSLPAFIASFTVGICPYKKLDFNLYRNPLKVYEYSSQGIPSVVQNCTLDDNTLSLVHMAVNIEGFVIQVSNILNGTQDVAKAQLIEFANLNTWKNRVESLAARLQEIGFK